MALLYKVLCREAGETVFRDTGEWFSGEECIIRIRRLMYEDPRREFKIVDDQDVVVVSTLDSAGREKHSAPATV